MGLLLGIVGMYCYLSDDMQSFVLPLGGGGSKGRLWGLINYKLLKFPTNACPKFKIVRIFWYVEMAFRIFNRKYGVAGSWFRLDGKPRARVWA